MYPFGPVPPPDKPEDKKEPEKEPTVGDAQATATAELDQLAEGERDPVYRWRFAEAIRAGYGPRLAEAIAYERRIDLERARKLAAVCGPDLAFDILW